MTVFISHSFQDKPIFENVIDALELASVPFWNPTDIKLGKSLRDGLRDAVNRCSLCIFVATHQSVRSSWCSAELGAFWGAKRPIIVFRADSSLTEDQLPEIVRGDVWEQNIRKIALSAKELVAEAESTATVAVPPSADQFKEWVVGAISLINAGGKEGLGQTAQQDVEDVEDVVEDVAGPLLRGINAASHVSMQSGDSWQRQILWVDDRPQNSQFERQAFESMGLELTLVRSTRQALETLAGTRFAAIVSSMRRAESPREGYVLLQAVRDRDRETPFFIYPGARSPESKKEGAARGAQGVTNMADELVDMVVATIPTEPTT